LTTPTHAAACPAGGAHHWQLGSVRQGGELPGRCEKCGLSKVWQPDPYRFMPGHPAKRGRPATKGVTR